MPYNLNNLYFINRVLIAVKSFILLMIINIIKILNLFILFCIPLIKGNKATESVPTGSIQSLTGQNKKSNTLNTGLLNTNLVKTPINNNQLIGLRQIHLTAPHKLDAVESAWLVGLIQGDGWFSMTKNGKYCKYEFGIELHIRDIQMLYKIKKALGVGTINIRKDQQKAMFRIRNKHQLRDIILPIFDLYPMFSTKQLKYLKFRENLLNNVIFYEDLIDIDSSKTNVINNADQIMRSPYFDNWLVGFIEAEGCFCIFKSKPKDLYNIVSFDVCQTGELELIKAIKNRLSITANPYIDKTNNVRIITGSFAGIQSVVTFLDQTNAKLTGYKRLQYLSFLTELRTNPKYKILKIPTTYGKNKSF